MENTISSKWNKRTAQKLSVQTATCTDTKWHNKNINKINEVFAYRRFDWNVCWVFVFVDTHTRARLPFAYQILLWFDFYIGNITRVMFSKSATGREYLWLSKFAGKKRNSESMFSGCVSLFVFDIAPVILNGFTWDAMWHRCAKN